MEEYNSSGEETELFNHRESMNANSLLPDIVLTKYGEIHSGDASNPTLEEFPFEEKMCKYLYMPDLGGNCDSDHFDFSRGYRVLYRAPSSSLSIESTNPLEGYLDTDCFDAEYQEKGDEESCLGCEEKHVTCFFSNIGLVRDTKIPGIFSFDEHEGAPPRPSDMKLDAEELKEMKKNIVTPRILRHGTWDPVLSPKASKYMWRTTFRSPSRKRKMNSKRRQNKLF